MLNAKDICDIIKACKGSGISELAVGDLIIRRGNPEALVEGIPTARAKPLLEEKIGVESLQTDEQMTKEDRLALLQLEDPLEYERLMLAGDLIDSTEGAKDEGHSGAESAFS